MEKTLLTTKLHRPPISTDMVGRKRLHEVLDRALDLPLTLVSAPAGYGKSTLVSHWVDLTERPCAWLSLDSEDSDLKNFVRYFVAAIRTVAADACNETQVLNDAPNLVPLSILSLCLCNELDAIESELLVVLDDYHRIDPRSDVHELMRILLEHPPQNLRIVMATRSDPPIHIALLRGRGLVTEVRLNDLKFIKSECSEYMDKSSKLRMSDIALVNLEKQTEGWIVALRLLSLYLQHIDDPEEFLRRFKGGVQQTREYLLLEVLNQLPSETGEWILKTAVLDRFCPELCDTLCMSGADMAQSEYNGRIFIKTLQTSNLFIIPLDAKGQWFRYHHLFQEMLLNQLETRKTSHEIAALHRLASEWYDTGGLVNEALKHAVAAEDEDLIVAIVTRHRHPTLNADRWYLLADWLAIIPEEIIHKNRELLMTRAWVLFHHYRFEALFPLLDYVETLIVDLKNQGPIHGEIQLCRGYGLFFLGKGEESLHYINQALSQLPESYYEARAQGEVIFALASQMIGQKKEAVESLDRLLSLYDSPDELRKTRLLTTYVFFYIINIEFTMAELADRRLREVVERGQYPYVVNWANSLQGFIHLHRGEWDDAVEYLGRSVTHRFTHFKRGAVDSIVGLMLAYQMQGRDDDVWTTFQILEDYVASMDDPSLWPLVGSARMRLSLIQRQSKSVGPWLKSLVSPLEDGAMLWWIEIPEITRCQALIVDSSPESLAEAEARLLELLEMNQAHHNEYQILKLQILLSLVSEKQAMIDKALVFLENALQLAAPDKLIFPFLELGPSVIELLSVLLPDSAAGPFIKSILSAAQSYESPAIQTSLDLLTNREQEVLELVANHLQTKEIADRLCISAHTVSTHLKKIYQKLDVNSRRQAVSKALELGIVFSKSNT